MKKIQVSLVFSVLAVTFSLFATQSFACGEVADTLETEADVSVASSSSDSSSGSTSTSSASGAN